MGNKQILVSWLFSVLGVLFGSTGETMGVDIIKFFPHLEGDMSKVIWAHAVNSVEALDKAILDGVNMIESDVIMGEFATGPPVKIPVMAHPPNTTSDLSFVSLLEYMVQRNNDIRRFGLKVDIKDNDAIVPTLVHLELYKRRIRFPVMLNADILQGPVQSEISPINASHFLSAARRYYPDAILSLGWTTRYGNDDKRDAPSSQTIKVGQYTTEHTTAMKRLIDANLDNTETITFAIRAGIAVQSVDNIVNLIGWLGHRTSVTLWSKPDDPVNLRQLNQFIAQVGRNRCFVDLPREIFDTDSNEDEDSSDDEKNMTSAPVKPFSIVHTALMIIVSILTSMLSGPIF